MATDDHTMVLISQNGQVLDLQRLQPSAAAGPRDPADMYLRSLAASGRPTMRSALNGIAALLGVPQTTNAAGKDIRYTLVPWGHLRAAHVAVIRAALADLVKTPANPDSAPLLGHKALATANKYLAALRGVLRAAYRLELMSAEDFQRACDIPPIRGESLLRGRRLRDDEIDRLIATCESDNTPLSIRDRAMIGVLCSTGMRRSEVVGLDIADYDPTDQHRLVVRSGKGNKDREVYVTEDDGRALLRWLTLRRTPGPASPRDGARTNALFTAIRKGGRVTHKRLDPEAVLGVLEKRGREAGIDEHFSPHDFRRTLISTLLEQGTDIVTTQKFVGHATPTTTGRYDRRGEEAKKQAIQQLGLNRGRRRGQER